MIKVWRTKIIHSKFDKIEPGKIIKLANLKPVIKKYLNMSIKEIPIIFNDRARGTSKMSKKVILEAIYMVPFLKFKKIFKLL